MRFLILSAFILATSSLVAQKFPYHENYKWEKNPVMSPIKQTDALYYYTKYNLTIEYDYDTYYGQYYKYKTEHYRVKLNTHIAIEEFNKVYIPMEDVVSLKSVKARVIKPSGVVELKPDVEEFFSDDESEQYYYFPVSGIELGDEIEILYTLKMESAVDGDQFFFQGEYPIYNFDFTFIAPTDSYFSFLAHNGLKKPELNDTVLQRHMWGCHMDTIPAFKAEYFSEYNNAAMKLDVTLRGFDTPSDRSYSPYDNFEVDLNAVYNRQLKGKDLKAVKELSARIGLNPRNRTEENIRLIENYVKLNIATSSKIPMTTPLYEVIATERAGAVGTILLFIALFEENDIRFEYGFISDRYDTHFSSEIESMHFIQNYIFYFPDIEKYMAPLDFNTRLGFLDSDWIPNNAILFSMKKYPFPETKGTVKAVPATSARENLDSTVIRIVVGQDFNSYEIEIERYLSGYEAGEFQTMYYLYNDARREVKEEELLDVLNDNSKFIVTYIENTNPEDAYIKPLIIKGKVTELHVPLMEFAGDKLIFKLGYLFGEYAPLKEIEKKKTDFIFANPFAASTRVEVVFPQGYSIINPQEIPVAEDMCPHETILIYSNLMIEGNKVIYYHGSQFESNHYGIDQKDIMVDIFKFWNSLHKMNLILLKN